MNIRWMKKEIDRGWDARDKTEEYYLGREKWNETILEKKEEELKNIIEKYDKLENELKNIKNSKTLKVICKIKKMLKKF